MKTSHRARTSFFRQSFFGAAIGTLVEYYDCALFGIFMPIFSPLFFPSQSTYQSMVKGYFVLLMTMLARPLGGLVFGYLGDVLGRRRALLTSMFGIAFATTAIGLTPSCAFLGVWATGIVVLAKAIQVFCFGGEFNGAGIYVIELAQQKQEAFMSSLLTATTLFGSLIGSLFGVLATYSFMPSWSWRLAFVLGGLIGVLGIIYRKNMIESPHFEQADLNRHHLKSMFKEYPQELVAGILIGGFTTLPFTTVAIFISPVLMTQGYFSSHQLMWVQTFLIFSAILTLLVTGLLAKRILPVKLMTSSATALILLAYPLLWLVDSGNFLLLILALLILVILNEIFLSPVHSYFKSLFTMQYRYRASSFSFCLGMSLIGGLTPLIEDYCYRRTKHFSSLAPWLILMSLGTLWSLSSVRKKQDLTLATQKASELTSPLLSSSPSFQSQMQIENIE